MQADRFNKIDEVKDKTFKKLDEVFETLRGLNLNPDDYKKMLDLICEYGKMEYKTGSMTIKAVYNVGILND